MSSPASLRQIPPLAVLYEWPRVAPLVRQAMEQGDGCYLEADVAMACMAGQWQLWVSGSGGEIKAVLITEILNFPRKRKCLLRYAAGTLGGILPHWEVFASWAREQGCDMVEIYGREGWEKTLPEWKKCHAVFQREL